MDILDPLELMRYSRHLNLPGFDERHQLLLKQAHVLIIGAGGLGVPVLQYLAAAGIGELTIVDGDKVDISNLQRQVIYRVNDVGKPKAEQAMYYIQKLNPHVRVTALCHFLTNVNTIALVRKADVVVDCTDNFAARYLINDACVLERRPLIYASVYQYEGQVAVFNFPPAPESINYRDLYPLPPAPEVVPDCASGGVLGVIPGIIGSMQALETIKLITGIAPHLSTKLLIYDGRSGTTKVLRLKKNPETNITSLINYDEFCGVSLHNSLNSSMKEITVQQLNEWRQTSKDFQLVDVREFNELNFVSIGGDHIPLGDIVTRASEVDANKDVVVMCRSGKRSAAAINALKNLGYNNLLNLKGGILAWAEEIDPSLPKY